MENGIDVIGDIHGHADQLEALLIELGYRELRGAWRHPSRSAIFAGDFVDRGPGQLRTLNLVRAMIDAGSARAVMGNHELNAIGWANRDPADEALHLRPRHGPKGEKNRRQHEVFLSEVGDDTDLHREWVDWFLELPLWIETPTYRVVHASWDPAAADVVRPHLRSGERLDPEQLHRAYRRDDPVGAAVDVLLKGPEIPLPDGCAFVDKDGHRRTEIRTRWWEPNARTYREAYIGPDGVDIPGLPLPPNATVPEPDRPTFIGHYWLTPSQDLAPLAPRVACVDYSVAKGGPLVAYRFEGETELREGAFVGVPTTAQTALAG